METALVVYGDCTVIPGAGLRDRDRGATQPFTGVEGIDTGRRGDCNRDTCSYLLGILGAGLRDRDRGGDSDILWG
jgi:hypothetical protein